MSAAEAIEQSNAMNEPISPRQDAPPIQQAIQTLGALNPLNSLDMPADPDAQATVTDFLDFTEYLPADIMRSLTLIGKLDETHVNASTKVHELATKWSQLPNIPPPERTSAVNVRADISEQLQQGMNARVSAHAEAVRMDGEVKRHYSRIKTILAKLETMLENYPPPEEIKSPVATFKSPQAAAGSKAPLRLDGHKPRRHAIPRITVPGEVLAPYELNYEPFTSDSESSSEDEDVASLSTSRVTPAPQPRIKVVKAPARPPKAGKAPKPRTSVPPPHVPGGEQPLSTSAALAQLGPPPVNPVIGGPDAPWGQLTPFELAKLRKKMKKNAAWTPSVTMIARELQALGRGYEAFKAAQQKAEQEGRVFEGKMPVPVKNPTTGEMQMPVGAVSEEALAADEANTYNRGMKLNEAKKLKRVQLAHQAAIEAEESAKLLDNVARILMNNSQPAIAQPTPTPTIVNNSRPKQPKKRKRESVIEADATKPESQIKRMKNETPVPTPQLNLQPHQRTAVPTPVLHSTTPIPLPIHAQDHSSAAKSSASVASATSPAPSSIAGSSSAAPPVPPIKLPPAETPIPPPLRSPRKSTTPILPPVRETRKTQMTRTQEQQQQQPTTQPQPQSLQQQQPPPPQPLPQQNQPQQKQQLQVQQQQKEIQSASRVTTPAADVPSHTPDQEELAVSTTVTAPPSVASTTSIRRKASSLEPQASLASERPRRTSTARNTPAPDKAPAETTTTTRTTGKRTKRPAPGVISRTVSGGNSAVGKRKAAPKKSARTGKGKDKAAVEGRQTAAAVAAMTAAAGAKNEMEVEVDDEGNVIDPDEPRYCLCNRVSFGIMIQCDNIDVSKQPNKKKKSASKKSGKAAASRGSATSTSTMSISTRSKTDEKGLRRKQETKEDVHEEEQDEEQAPNKENAEENAESYPSQTGKKRVRIARSQCSNNSEDKEDGEIWGGNQNNQKRHKANDVVNPQKCQQEWFHLECVGLTAIPARTTKWYCPDCRKALNIGEKGEVSARGIKA
ncbi:uncharacterized protein B0T23DRAFT_114607 [Neurospora hispaniola]|uniref:Inhibitor of growth protein N-terminal histone-binding domain-containing protein n=1 Tax=Neurospora hispaniola TaxID=588809 RepID=A0AAJ0MSF4_9PEZI|nr:hypothetical protein B0T23DRAFT_114607 [Neurospora hispaniola]